MSRGFSAYLDLVRFLAALTVLVSHFAYPRFTDGDFIIVRTLNLGSDAVVIFFVLSGLVIAYAAEREGTAGSFAFRRTTRLVSVAAPALVLTVVLDSLGVRLNPEAYDGWWYNPLGAGETLIRGLTFSNEWSFSATRLGTNGPYWSLSYEAAYYMLFGVAIFTTGATRVVLLAILAALVGPRVLLLMPAWLLGVLLWHVIRDGRASGISRGLALVFAAGCPALYALMLIADVPSVLAVATQALLAPYHAGLLLRFSDEFVWNTLIAALVALQFLAMARLLGDGSLRGHGRAVRWLAGASFSIYLVHYPGLQFVDAVLPEALPLRGLVLIASVLALCFLFAQLFERQLPAFRTALTWLVPASARSVPSRSVAGR